MSSSKETQRLQDIVENIDAILAYVGHMSFDAFSADRKTVDASERCLQRMTEAAIKIGEARMREIAPFLPLHAVRGLGNLLRHDYDQVELSTIFATIRDRLPALREACAIALKDAL